MKPRFCLKIAQDYVQCGCAPAGGDSIWAHAIAPHVRKGSETARTHGAQTCPKSVKAACLESGQFQLAGHHPKSKLLHSGSRIWGPGSKVQDPGY